MTLRALALPIGIAALANLAAILPAQAQTPPGAFNPMTYLAPMMTPFGIIMAPVTNPGAGGFNPAAMMNPANFPNPQALMPALPAGMQPFTGLQMPPQAYGMPPQMANPYAGMMPFPLPMPLPAPAPNAGIPSLPFPFFPPAR
jgi:hypothetical protein